jgi:Holliday junction resolvase-like predicted endonuclease
MLVGFKSVCGRPMRQLAAVRQVAAVRHVAARGAMWLSHVFRHARRDGVAVAVAFLLRGARALADRARRDPGERAAERFLRALGYRVVARNWRSPRDRRDEADLLVRSPDGASLVIVEVKRASGPWDPLGRVDTRKKEVLWRLLLDLEGAVTGVACDPRGPAGGKTSAYPRGLRSVRTIRVDLVGVEGDGRNAVVRAHGDGIFERSIGRRHRAQRPPPGFSAGDR